MRGLLVLMALRLKEPSTWAGIASIGVAAGLFSAEQSSAITTYAPEFFIAISGLAAVFLPEKPEKKKAPKKALPQKTARAQRRGTQSPEDDKPCPASTV